MSWAVFVEKLDYSSQGRGGGTIGNAEEESSDVLTSIYATTTQSRAMLMEL